jgi:hypothetical protein
LRATALAHISANATTKGNQLADFMLHALRYTHNNFKIILDAGNVTGFFEEL